MNQNEKELRDTLADLSADEDFIERMIILLQSGQLESLKSNLMKLRIQLLSDIHVSQNKLYSIDYVLRKIM